MTEKTIINNESLSTSKQYNKEWAELISELANKKQELEHVKKQLENIADNWDNKISDYAEQLAIELSKLNSVNATLSKLPKNISESIRQLIPAISHELHSTMFEGLRASIKTCDDSLTQLASRAESIINSAENIKQNSFKKTAITITAMLLISIITASVSSYIVLRNFPNFVNINHNGSIHIEQSDVAVWGRHELSEGKKQQQ